MPEELVRPVYKPGDKADIPAGQMYPTLATGAKRELKNLGEYGSKQLKGNHASEHHEKQGVFDHLKKIHPKHAIIWVTDGSCHLVWPL